MNRVNIPGPEHVGVRKDGGGVVDGGEGGAYKIQSTCRGNPHDRNLLHYYIFLSMSDTYYIYMYVRASWEYKSFHFELQGQTGEGGLTMCTSPTEKLFWVVLRQAYFSSLFQ